MVLPDFDIKLGTPHFNAFKLFTGVHIIGGSSASPRIFCYALVISLIDALQADMISG